MHERKNQLSVTRVFRDIRTTFFPRWDVENAWRVKVGNSYEGIASEGFWDNNLRVIFIRDDCIQNREKLEAVLIHEVCHALTGTGHRVRFVSRLEKAKDRALKLGRTSLAELLNKDNEISCYSNSPAQGHADVYGCVEDLIWHRPEITYNEVLAFLSSEFAVLPGDLVRRYKRLRRVFDKAKKSMDALRLRQSATAANRVAAEAPLRTDFVPPSAACDV